MGFLDTGYQEPPAAPTFQLLAEGDYKFRISECSGIEVTDNGHEKLSVVLAVNEQKVYAFLYCGTSREGKPFDMISPFCKSLSINPTNQDARNPRYWASLVGKTGQCRIIQEEQVGGKYAGQLQNKVKYFIYPKNVRGPAQPTRITSTAAPARRQRDPDLDVEPDDIPFHSTVYKDVHRNKLNRRTL